MHELAFIENIVTACTEAALNNGLSRVSRVSIVVGKLHQLVPDLMHFAFETATENSILGGAELEIEWIPVSAFCRDCSKTIPVNDGIYICPECGSFNLRLIAGKELYIKHIEGESHEDNDHEERTGPEPEYGGG